MPATNGTTDPSARGRYASQRWRPAGEPDDARVQETASRMTSVGKALKVLAAFRGTAPRLGVSEIARRAGLPKSTAFRLLADLEKAGFVEREGQDYRLGITLFELGSRVRFCRPNGLRDTAMHHMSQLHLSTRLSVHLGVMEGADVVYLAKVNRGHRTLRGHLQPGARAPMTCSALGKAILAFSPPEVIQEVVNAGLPRRTRYSISEPSRLVRELRRVRDRGVAFEHEEVTIGVVGIAAPIRLEGRAVAAVSVSLTPPLVNSHRIAATVLDTARRISLEQDIWSDPIW